MEIVTSRMDREACGDGVDVFSKERDEVLLLDVDNGGIVVCFF